MKALYHYEWIAMYLGTWFAGYGFASSGWRGAGVSVLGALFVTTALIAQRARHRRELAALRAQFKP